MPSACESQSDRKHVPEVIPAWVLIVLALAILVAWVVGASILFCADRDVERRDQP